MRKKIKIGISKSQETTKTPGLLRYEAAKFLEKSEALELWNFPPWLNGLLNHLEDRFTPVRPSLSDRSAIMVAIAALLSDKPQPDVPQNIQDAAAYFASALGLDVKGDPELRWFADSPDAGDPLCICSYCLCLIEEGAVPIRFFGEDNREQQLHEDCFQTCISYGITDADGIPRI